MHHEDGKQYEMKRMCSKGQIKHGIQMRAPFSLDAEHLRAMCTRLRGGAGARTDASCVSGKTRRRTGKSLAYRQRPVFEMRWERTPAAAVQEWWSGCEARAEAAAAEAAAEEDHVCVLRVHFGSKVKSHMSRCDDCNDDDSAGSALVESGSHSWSWTDQLESRLA